MSIFIGLKILHLGALVLWLGPGLGAWLMMLVINNHFGEPGRVSHLAWQLFLKLMWLEHIALAVLLGSGVLLGWQTGQFDTSWLQAKLLIVVLFLLPLELVDVWFVHHRLPRLFAHRQVNTPYSEREYQVLRIYHQRFTPLALLTLPVAVIGIMWLAISKTF